MPEGNYCFGHTHLINTMKFLTLRFRYLLDVKSFNHVLNDENYRSNSWYCQPETMNLFSFSSPSNWYIKSWHCDPLWAALLPQGTIFPWTPRLAGGPRQCQSRHTTSNTSAKSGERYVKQLLLHKARWILHHEFV